MERMESAQGVRKISSQDERERRFILREQERHFRINRVPESAYGSRRAPQIPHEYRSHDWGQRNSRPPPEDIYRQDHFHYSIQPEPQFYESSHISEPIDPYIEERQYQAQQKQQYAAELKAQMQQKQNIQSQQQHSDSFDYGEAQRQAELAKKQRYAMELQQQIQEKRRNSGTEQGSVNESVDYGEEQRNLEKLKKQRYAEELAKQIESKKQQKPESVHYYSETSSHDTSDYYKKQQYAAELRAQIDSKHQFTEIPLTSQNHSMHHHPTPESTGLVIENNSNEHEKRLKFREELDRQVKEAQKRKDEEKKKRVEEERLAEEKFRRELEEEKASQKRPEAVSRTATAQSTNNEPEQPIIPQTPPEPPTSHPSLKMDNIVQPYNNKSNDESLKTVYQNYRQQIEFIKNDHNIQRENMLDEKEQMLIQREQQLEQMLKMVQGQPSPYVPQYAAYPQYMMPPYMQYQYQPYPMAPPLGIPQPPISLAQQMPPHLPQVPQTSSPQIPYHAMPPYNQPPPFQKSNTELQQNPDLFEQSLTSTTK